MYTETSTCHLRNKGLEYRLNAESKKPSY